MHSLDRYCKKEAALAFAKKERDEDGFQRMQVETHKRGYEDPAAAAPPPSTPLRALSRATSRM